MNQSASKTPGGSDAPLLLDPPATASPCGESIREIDTKPRKSARYESLTFWRGAACLMLLVYHSAFYADHTWRTGDRSTWTLGGFSICAIDRLSMGVPIFFVVSGYCIAASIDSLRRRDHSLQQYFYRRCRRIYPPLWCAYGFGILVTTLVTAAGYQHCKQLPVLSMFSPGVWLGNLTASESWLPHLRGSHSGTFLLPNTWTLCYEEQFYVVTGLILALAARRFFTVAYLIAAATLLIRHLAASAGWNISGFFFDGLWIMFCAGILVYERLNYDSIRRSMFAWAALVTGAIYGAYMRVALDSATDRHFGERMFAGCAFALLLIYLRRWDRRIAEAKLLRPIAWCGQISYSVFLTHYPIVVFVASWLAQRGIRSDGMVALITVPLCLAVSLPIAWAFYMVVERHFLNAPAESKRHRSVKNVDHRSVLAGCTS